MLSLILLAFFLAGSYGSTLRAHPPMLDQRIVGGSEVGIQSHPYQLSLQNRQFHVCGASIISSRWIVTAGHCVHGSTNLIKSYSIKAGSDLIRNGTTYIIKRVIQHPNFDSKNIDWDIALLEVEKEIKINNKTIAPVKLANHELPAGVMVNITGWGVTSQGGHSPKRLQRVTVPIIDRNLCKNTYEGVGTITPRMICAGDITEGGKDSCQGDSGGPLTNNGILYGIVSWGYGCAKPRYPGVYTNVATVRSWIKNTTGI